MITAKCSERLSPVAALVCVCILLVSWGSVAQAGEGEGYLDFLDAYYKTYDVSYLMQAQNSIKSDLDTSAALRFQGYYYNTEIQYLLALEDLRKDPNSVEEVEKLKGLMLQLYSRYLDAYYRVETPDIHASNIPGNTAFLFKDILMAATFIQNANSCSPLLKNVLRRAKQDKLYNEENSFVASVADMMSLEYPNLFGVANLVKAVWLNDQFMNTDANDARKDSLRESVSYYAAIASDTLKSDYGKSISYFLLAETYANVSNDMAWEYFQKCVDLFRNGYISTTGFYDRNYNQEIYLATAVAFFPAYSEYLFDNGRYPEIAASAKYLIDLDMLDRGKAENVTKEAIFWGEKSIRKLQDGGKFANADELFRQIQGFYELLEPDSQYGTGPEN
ncbi:MAG: hypothetical protein KKH67_03490 [candidate division Zixibacteria bacterium]|nr:hypothetical protein [candidate division Zixibacteria bacterium]MBU1470106.1 hypothetical protein [candidate division Zixibacteria bacterium]